MNLPDSLLAEVRDRAASSGRTVTSLVEEALRDLLDKHVSDGEELGPPPTFGSPEGRVLVDLEDKDALWDVIDRDWMGRR